MPENYRKICFFVKNHDFSGISLYRFGGRQCMPMPDMAAFLVFPTGSETGGYPLGPGRSMQCSLSPVRAGASCFVSFFALAKFQVRVGEFTDENRSLF